MNSSDATENSNGRVSGLDRDAIHRYSRQLLVPAFGVQSQTRLLSSSVVIIGAGGLGSPVALYLAGAGIGTLGIVDRDCVELSNLHRQIIHTEARVGQPKAESAAAACRALNSSIEVRVHGDGLTPANALEVIGRYDVVVDATDNAASRYLINDACVVLQKPLVSAAALGTEGQLTVYNHRQSDGPCYRCLFPVPPPPAACARCADAGVLGVVPGVMGSLQALEAVKLASGTGEPLSKRMLLLDGLSGRITTVKLRGRNPACDACGDSPTVTAETIAGFDFEAFTQGPMSDAVPTRLQLVPDELRVSASDYASRAQAGEVHVLLDVRAPHQFAIAALPAAVNIPLAQLQARIGEVRALVGEEPSPLYVICRRGNDSQRAVLALTEAGFGRLADVRGGLEAWAQDVDASFPVY